MAYQWFCIFKPFYYKSYLLYIKGNHFANTAALYYRNKKKKRTISDVNFCTKSFTVKCFELQYAINHISISIVVVRKSSSDFLNICT